MRPFPAALALLAAAGPAQADALADGLKAYRKHDYATALKDWKPLAEAGEIRGEFVLAVHYDEGHGVSQDYAKAAEWYRKSSDHGFAAASYDLARYYMTGRGVTRDDVAAACLFCEAAERGLATAQFDLAQLYRLGHGVPQDDASAAGLYRQAADQGLRGRPSPRLRLTGHAAPVTGAAPRSRRRNSPAPVGSCRHPAA